MSAPVQLLRKIDLFEELSDKDLEMVAQTFKEREFPAGHTIARQGESGVGFFVIEEGTVSYEVGGVGKGTGGPGDYFGEVALIDDGPRTASVITTSEVKAYGLTSWEFRPIVEENAHIAWLLLKGLAKRLRALQADS